jgi:hypothetical protein
MPHPALSPIPEASSSLEAGLNDLLSESNTDSSPNSMLSDPTLSDSTATSSPSSSVNEATIINEDSSSLSWDSTAEPVPVVEPVPTASAVVPTGTESGLLVEGSVSLDGNKATVDQPTIVNAITPAEELPSNTVNEQQPVDKVSTDLYNNLVALLNGTSFDANNWVILLTKAMALVSPVKTLNKSEKIQMCVNLVIRYLDEKTDLSDETLKFIKSSVAQMCISLLDGQSSMVSKSGASGKLDTKVDPDMLITPIQIIGSLVNKIQTSMVDKKSLALEISAVVLMCISVVDKYRHLTGIEKKDIVIAAITQYTNTSVLPTMQPNSTEFVAVTLLLASLPNIVDTCVAVAKGKPAFKFDFKDPETRNCLLRVFTAILSSCSPKNTQG